ncbi:MAG: ribosomal protein S18-alanine N-acetyltransferase [Vulcanimicrobiaceae bacterium]
MQIEPMTMAHIKDVTRIEAQSFPTTWPSDAFYNELQTNTLAHYFIAKVDDVIIGYGGCWVIMEDAHVTTIAVLPEHRGKGYGERLLLTLIDEAITRGGAWLTLEVREGNISAQQLYRKYGFTTVAVRKQYYSDNNENALVMWAGNLKSELYRNRLQALRAQLVA